MKANDTIAAENRKKFDRSNVFVLNIISSPGAGKTTLLELTLEELSEAAASRQKRASAEPAAKKNKYKIGVIVGDVATSKDAHRLQKFNVPIVQINTQGACHLDANMLSKALNEIQYESLDILFIENVGNLVCPAGYKLGEHAKIVILSVPEGEDKPTKYPLIFRNSDLMILNKMDLLPYCNINVDSLLKDAANINPKMDIIRMSCKTKEGTDSWFLWLQNRFKIFKQPRSKTARKGNH